MENGLLVWLFLTLLFDCFALLKPHGARLFLGTFFVAMSLGVNLVIALSNPRLIAALGAESFIPFYRSIFQRWVAMEPLLFLIPIILFELAVGVLLLGGGRASRTGLLGAMLFLVLIAPLHLMTLPNLVLAIGVGMMMRGDPGRGLLDMMYRRGAGGGSSVFPSSGH